MARLPRPGGDIGNWGHILNDYLKTTLTDSGALKDNIVTESKLAPAVRTKLNTSSGGAVADGSVTTAKLANAAVTSSKLADGSVTDAKIVGSISQNKISGLSSALSGKADASHTHTIANVSGLQAALDGKAGSSHVHALDDLSDVNVSGATDGQALVLQGGQWGAATLTGEGGSGVTDHGALTGLSDDDHPQYLNNARGDVRYYTKSEVDSSLSGKVDTTDPRLTNARIPTDGSVTTAKLSDEAVTEAKLSSGVQAKLNATGGGAVSSVAGRTGDVTLTKVDVGLSNVDNTSDSAKPISTATQTALDTKANANAVVGLVGNQTVAGVKTFSSSPVVPAPTADGQAANKQYVDTAIAGAGGGGGAVTTIGTEVLFSSIPGADDDAKLTAFMDANRSQTMKGRTLVLDEMRDYTFTQQQTLYSGFSIRGPFRPQDQARGSLPLGNRIRLRMSGAPKGWFIAPAGVNTFGISMTNLSIDGNSNSRVIEGSSGVIWTSVFRDIAIQNALGVFGSPSQKVLFTACCIDGWWNINNVQNRAWYIGGSDCFITPSMMLLDSPPELLPDNQFLAEFNYMSKTVVEHMYVTAEGHSAFRFQGGTYEQPVIITNSYIEGRNANAPCKGSLIRVEGGEVDITQTWLAFAMTDPAATGRNDGGVVHVSGGNVYIEGCTYRRANGVAENVPFVYATGGKVRIRNVRGSQFTGKPVVRQTVAGLIDADDSVTVVTD